MANDEVNTDLSVLKFTSVDELFDGMMWRLTDILNYNFHGNKKEPEKSRILYSRT